MVRVLSFFFRLVQVVGLEPTRCCQRKILSLVRLPIPPHLHNIDMIS